ncbi:uncharacterized protein N7458_008715 [Penicillium daleae]|uniref:glutathione transferase n=1 Tax=Penicillium daleae TaxID=63821 RepID=A0AAD6C381_9EURO|nr:uncharacterized protein N7458_008715 [Penicillium daleae]KAJ5444843.1 hypothetical protein N7458_008715 [Penicillium daleae]
MVLQLVGAPTSWNTLRARHVLFEKGLYDIELVYLDLANGDHKKPAHVAKNPYAKVPVLIDGDFTIFESRAIARYVASKYGDSTSLVPSPTDFEGIGLFEQAASVELTHFDRIAEPFVLKHVIAKFRGTPVSEDETSSGLADLAPKLDTLNDILTAQIYMSGGQFSLVDAFYMPLVHLLVGLGFRKLIFERPHLKRWWETVSQREAWRKAVQPFNTVYGF